MLDLIFDDERIYEIMSLFFTKSSTETSKQILVSLEQSLFQFIWKFNNLSFLAHKESLYFLPHL
jgi:hypothetical protein